MWTQTSVSLCDENLINIAILVRLTRRNEDYEMIGIDCYCIYIALMLVSSVAQNNTNKPRTQIFKLGVGRCVLATILAKVSIEMDSFLHDVVRGDRLPASIILRIKGASAGFDAKGTRS